MPQFADDLRLGPVYLPNADTTNPSPMELGVGPLGRVYVWDIVPLTLDADGLSVSATPSGAGDLVLAAAAGVTATTDATGTVRYVLDVPRCVTVNAAGANTSTFTIYGYDVYGQKMSETIAAPSTSTVATTKAFKSVTRISISAAAGSAIIAGYNDKFGFPLRVTDAGYLAQVKWDNTLAANAGTFVAADTTSPATTTTDDVRGCFTPSSAADGSKRLVALIALPALAAGANATRIGAAGVDQNGW